MPGKEDLFKLTSYITSSGAENPEDSEGIASVVMNRAVQLGNLDEAISSLEPSEDFVRMSQGEMSDGELKKFKKTIQTASRLLRGQEDKTGGAFFFFPNKNKPSQEFNLEKTHGTKNFSFYKQGAEPTPAESVQSKRRSKVRKLS